MKSEKIKFTNTLQNNVQLGDEINGTKGTKQLLKNETSIEHKMACLSKLTDSGRPCGSNKCNNVNEKIMPDCTIKDRTYK